MPDDPKTGRRRYAGAFAALAALVAATAPAKAHGGRHHDGPRL